MNDIYYSKAFYKSFACMVSAADIIESVKRFNKVTLIDDINGYNYFISKKIMIILFQWLLIALCSILIVIYSAMIYLIVFF